MKKKIGHEELGGDTKAQCQKRAFFVMLSPCLNSTHTIEEK